MHLTKRELETRRRTANDSTFLPTEAPKVGVHEARRCRPTKSRESMHTTNKARLAYPLEDNADLLRCPYEPLFRTKNSSFVAGRFHRSVVSYNEICCDKNVIVPCSEPVKFALASAISSEGVGLLRSAPDGGSSA